MHFLKLKCIANIKSFITQTHNHEALTFFEIILYSIFILTFT